MAADSKKPGVRTVEELRDHLQTALELEHATIPPYFTAWISANDEANPIAVQVIRSVMIEEMLHLTLAANLMNAVGGYPDLTHPQFTPRYPHRLPHSSESFLVSIEKFSRESLETFLKIERPEMKDALPEAGKYQTIGQFYDALADGFKFLCGELGPERIFTGAIERQITPQDYYGSGQLVVVRDLASALAAIDEIKEQGEGADDSVFDEDDVIIGSEPGFEPAHYFRFKELQLGRRYRPGDSLRSGPTGSPIVVHFEAVFPAAKNPRLSDYANGSPIRIALEEFCDAYQALLADLHAAFNGNPSQLASGMARMFDIKQRALALIRTPVRPGASETIGLVFRRD